MITEYQRKVYEKIHEAKGEDDMAIYSLYKEDGLSIGQIAYEFDKSFSTIYRTIKRVESFLSNVDWDYYNVCALHYVAPKYTLIRGTESIHSLKIVMYAISIYFTVGVEYLDQFHYHNILDLHSSIKNSKNTIEKEIRNSYWYSYETKEKIRIFEKFDFSRNKIYFTLTNEVKLFLESVKLFESGIN